MDKYIYNENNGLWYERGGDYYLPCLALPEQRSTASGVKIQSISSMLAKNSTFPLRIILSGSTADIRLTNSAMPEIAVIVLNVPHGLLPGPLRIHCRRLSCMVYFHRLTDWPYCVEIVTLNDKLQGNAPWSFVVI